MLSGLYIFVGVVKNDAMYKNGILYPRSYKLFSDQILNSFTKLCFLESCFEPKKLFENVYKYEFKLCFVNMD